jgi:flagellar biosynthetic protein FliR
VLTVSAAELDAFVAAFFYPFLRIIALMSSAPLFSHASVPVQVRIPLALVLTAVVAPMLPAAPFVSPYSAQGVVLIIAQILIGVSIGFVLQIVFAAVTLAGDMIGLQMGLSFAAFIDPQNSDEAPIVGSFLSLGLMLIFLAINGHLALINAVVDSFTALPIAPMSWRALDLSSLVGAGASMFSTGLSISLPVVGALLLVNLTLGVLTRTAPQLNLFAVGFPMTLIVGLAMLVLVMPFALPALQNALTHAFAALAR